MSFDYYKYKDFFFTIFSFLSFFGLIIMIILYLIRNKIIEKKAQKIINDAEIKKNEIIYNANLEANKIFAQKKQEIELEIKEKKQNIFNLENNLLKRESNIASRDNNLNEKEKLFNIRQEKLENDIKNFEIKEQEIKKKNSFIISELEKISCMNKEEARKEILERVKENMDLEINKYLKKREADAKEIADDKARNIISLSISRYAQNEIATNSIMNIHIPDEMKGRIIGREGRNIKLLEQLLGVDLIIDDTPEIITISCFNPLRREIAKKTIEYLIKDGRIQPNSIEEFAEKSTNEINEEIHKSGQKAVFELGLSNVPSELLDYIGRLKFRTSYGQNVYNHSIEVAYLAGIMAAELGLNQNLAKRAGLLHDIGKAVDYEIDGTHVELGVQIAKKFGESDVVINTIASHHEDEEAKYDIAVLVSAADTLSAARPGARNKMLETYIKRIEQLEKICISFPGVSKAYALRSGKELRVIVMSEKVSDVDTFKLARSIKEKIETDLNYPGEININVIREFRVMEKAK